MQNKEPVTIEEIIKKVKDHNKKANINLIREAYECANIHHKDQVRMSGEPYIDHPLEVAYILADLKLDDSTICAALLHDVVEDTILTREDIVNEFGEEIAEMVDGVTKLRKNSIYYSRGTTSGKLQKNVSRYGKRYKGYINKTCRQTT